VSLRKEVLSKVLKKTLEARFKRTERSKVLKNKDREKKAMRVGCLHPSTQHT
jgi:hypothetical protein